MAEIDPSELVEAIREGHEILEWEPLRPDDALGKWRQWPLVHEESLNYLHRNWALPSHLGPDPAARGLKAKILRRFGRVVFRVLGDYLREERELVAQLVRFNDTLAKRCDQMAETIARRQVEEAASQARLAAWLHARSGESQKHAG